MEDFVVLFLCFKFEFNEERFDIIRYVIYNIINLELLLLYIGILLF